MARRFQEVYGVDEKIRAEIAVRNRRNAWKRGSRVPGAVRSQPLMTSAAPPRRRPDCRGDRESRTVESVERAERVHGIYVPQGQGYGGGKVDWRATASARREHRFDRRDGAPEGFDIAGCSADRQRFFAVARHERATLAGEPRERRIE